jgi:hypothetical protein
MRRAVAADIVTIVAPVSTSMKVSTPFNITVAEYWPRRSAGMTISRKFDDSGCAGGPLAAAGGAATASVLAGVEGDGAGASRETSEGPKTAKRHATAANSTAFFSMGTPDRKRIRGA